MKNKLLPIVCFVLALIACSKQESGLETGPSPGSGDGITPDLVIVDHRLTPQNIKGYTEIVLNNLGRTTRSGDIGDVRVIRSKDIFTHSANLTKSATSEEQGNDTLMYAVNLSSDNGFVLLSADSRVPVLAIVDKGNFTEIGDNPGFDMFLKMSKPYIDHSIAEYNHVSDSINDKADVHTRIIGGYPNGNDQYIGLYIEDRHLDNRLVSPLLKTEWCQISPFNNLFGTCKEDGGELKTGCVPLALAQLFAYHRYPKVARYQIDSLTNAKMVFNYTEMFYRFTKDSEASRQVANLVKDVAISIGVNYNHDLDGEHSTGADDHRNLRKVLPAYGYIKTGSWGPVLPYALNDYRSGEVKESLDYKRPVYISGNDGETGHAWLLDGYVELYRERKIFEKWFSPIRNTYYYKLISTQTWPVDHYLIHCNWGWYKGDSNGFFNEGIWNSNKPIDPEFPHTVQKSTQKYYYQYDIGIYSHLRPM